jgi:hypothetical protein
MLFREHLCLLNESDVTRLYKTNHCEFCHTMFYTLLALCRVIVAIFSHIKVKSAVEVLTQNLTAESPTTIFAEFSPQISLLQLLTM